MLNVQIMAASSIKCQFQESKLSNQKNREGRSLCSRPSFRIVRGLSSWKV